MLDHRLQKVGSLVNHDRCECKQVLLNPNQQEFRKFRNLSESTLLSILLAFCFMTELFCPYVDQRLHK